MEFKFNTAQNSKT